MQSLKLISSWGPKTALIFGSCTRLHLFSWLQAAFEGRGSWDTCPVSFLIFTSSLPHPWLKCFSFHRGMLWPFVALRTEGFLLEIGFKLLWDLSWELLVPVIVITITSCQPSCPCCSHPESSLPIAVEEIAMYAQGWIGCCLDPS